MNRRPSDFVDVLSLEPTVLVDLMYFGSENFVGRRIDGYKANRCYLTRAAAEGIQKAQARLQKVSRWQNRQLSLLLKDCYRPQRAVDHFVRWAGDRFDTKNKEIYYPELEKSELFSLHYIAKRSGHSRGSTVDLTIVEIRPNGELLPLDFGTIVDFLGEESNTHYPRIPNEAKESRKLLVNVMSPEFSNYSKEWWHFTLKNEPYPNTAFDFEIN